MNYLNDLSPAQLRQAADIREKIESLQHELSTLLVPATQSQDVTTAPKRKMSQAAIAKIRAAAKARWAKIAETPEKAHKQPKRTMSAAAKAKLAAIARARWKKVRAAGKRAL